MQIENQIVRCSSSSSHSSNSEVGSQQPQPPGKGALPQAITTSASSKPMPSVAWYSASARHKYWVLRARVKPKQPRPDNYKARNNSSSNPDRGCNSGCGRVVGIEWQWEPLYWITSSSSRLAWRKRVTMQCNNKKKILLGRQWLGVRHHCHPTC